MKGEQGSYEVHHHRHGILIRGPIPVSDLAGLEQIAKERGFTYLDAGICQALGGSFCFVSKASGPLWRAEIEASLTHREPVKRWLAGPDTGASSTYLCRLLAGLGTGDVAVPYDAADFGRCVRMLDATGLRGELEKASAVPSWAPIVKEWVTLENMYAAQHFGAIRDTLRMLGRTA